MRAMPGRYIISSQQTSHNKSKTNKNNNCGTSAEKNASSNEKNKENNTFFSKITRLHIHMEWRVSNNYEMRPLRNSTESMTVRSHTHVGMGEHGNAFKITNDCRKYVPNHREVETKTTETHTKRKIGRESIHCSVRPVIVHDECNFPKPWTHFHVCILYLHDIRHHMCCTMYNEHQ